MQTYRSVSGSSAEDLFIELFSDTFGAEKAGYLYSQYPFSDIYQNSRFADFLIENGGPPLTQSPGISSFLLAPMTAACQSPTLAFM